MLGTTANAMANMEALVERYGPAPRAFLVVPMVGAFFIDFTNALIITASECRRRWSSQWTLRSATDRAVTGPAWPLRTE